MSLAEQWHIERKARLARLSPAPKAVVKQVIPAAPLPPPQHLPYDAGWANMWHYDLVTMRERPPLQISVKHIQSVVSLHFGVDVRDMLAHRRTSDIVLPRHVAMYLTKKLTGRSLSEIGRLFGRRDHTTVMHGIRRIEYLVQTDDELFRAIAQLRRRFI